MDEARLQQVLDRMEISDTIIRFARALDIKDWELCRSCFINEIETDYSDLRGQPASSIKADEFVELRRKALSGLKTQHLSTNHIITIEGNEATCISCMVIHRILPNKEGEDFFDTHGYYTHTLVRTSQGWKISKVKQTVLWNKGNPQIHLGALHNSPESYPAIAPNTQITQSKQLLFNGKLPNVDNYWLR